MMKNWEETINHPETGPIPIVLSDLNGKAEKDGEDSYSMICTFEEKGLCWQSTGKEKKKENNR